MKNALGLKRFPLKRLKVGQAALVGPYHNSNRAGATVTRASGEGRKYTQQQMLMIDPGDMKVYRFYLVRRVQ